MSSCGSGIGRPNITCIFQLGGTPEFFIFTLKLNNWLNRRLGFDMTDIWSVPNAKKTREHCLVFLLISTMLIFLVLHESLYRRISERERERKGNKYKKGPSCQAPNSFNFTFTATGMSLKKRALFYLLVSQDKWEWECSGVGIMKLLITAVLAAFLSCHLNSGQQRTAECTNFTQSCFALSH